MSGNLALLLDTHILAWTASGGKRLSPAATDQLSRDTLFVSAVIAFEYEDLRLRGRFDDDVPLVTLQRDLGFDLVDFTAQLSVAAAELPPIHRDPIDRMLVAHAISMGMTVVTADRNIHKYGVRWIV